MKNIKTKNCNKCNRVFEKKPTVSYRKWNKIKHCSISCAKKGIVAWNKGLKLSEDHKEHLKESIPKGRCTNTGRTHIKEGQSIGRNTQFKNGQIPWNYGLTVENDKRLAHGDRSGTWKGGVTPINLKIRKSSKYKKWRTQVFERDDYTCTICKDRGVALNADHIKPFSTHPELRFELDNGRTLCVDCHKLTDSYGVNTGKKEGDNTTV